MVERRKGEGVERERERETRKEASLQLCVLLAGASADIVLICVWARINTCMRARAHLQLLLVVAPASLLAPDRGQLDNVLLLFLIHAFEPSRLAFGCAPPGLPAGRRRLPLCTMGRCFMSTFSFCVALCVGTLCEWSAPLTASDVSRRIFDTHGLLALSLAHSRVRALPLSLSSHKARRQIVNRGAVDGKLPIRHIYLQRLMGVMVLVRVSCEA